MGIILGIFCTIGNISVNTTSNYGKVTNINERKNWWALETFYGCAKSINQMMLQVILTSQLTGQVRRS